MKLDKTIFDCKLVQIPKHKLGLANHVKIPSEISSTFNVKRIYYLYDVPSGAERGGHAHYELEQYIVAVSGSFDVVLDDGSQKKIFSLNRPDIALHIVPGLWRSIENFSSGSVCLVLASEHFYESDYIRNYQKFLQIKKTIKN
jgi:hypothetical protein